MITTKEVRFDIWCAKCKHKDKAEGEEPCHDCLDYGGNEDSEKPVRFEEPEKE